MLVIVDLYNGTIDAEPLKTSDSKTVIIDINIKYV